MRVVSLLPSATEMLYAIDVEPVAVSHECDHPPAARDLPTVVRSRVDPDASSAEINEQVAEAEAAGGVYEIDRDLLEELDPDVVVSQGICDVCAVDDSAIRQAVADRSLDAEVVAARRQAGAVRDRRRDRHEPARARRGRDRPDARGRPTRRGL